MPINSRTGGKRTLDDMASNTCQALDGGRSSGNDGGEQHDRNRESIMISVTMGLNIDGFLRSAFQNPESISK
jgi:hypothetical protein